MNTLHYKHWPDGVPHHVSTPSTNLFENLEITAKRYPNKNALIFYDSLTTWSELKNQAENLAGYLTRSCGVKPGDRVGIYLQNSPQYIISFYAIMRANAVVVPINPMLAVDELAHIIRDSGARTVIIGQELLARIEQLPAGLLHHGIVTAYSDAITAPTELNLPDFIKAPHQASQWQDFRVALTSAPPSEPCTRVVGDLAALPYTSGTTGLPKGCILTHANFNFIAASGTTWNQTTPDATGLAVVPMFHITGLNYGVTASVYVGMSIVILPRWDRDVAAQLIARYQVTHWTCIPTMWIDLLASPNIDNYDLSSLKKTAGGGAAMPQAVAQKIIDRYGLYFQEGYGLTETCAPSHTNPVQNPKLQCLGIPYPNTDSRIINPDTLEQLPQGESGEIITHGPQVFSGYWQDAEKTAKAFIEIEGKKFFRTGDLARIDEDGYFFMVDRLKRMINASGFKVWPAEVEAMMYSHPAIAEACIIGVPDGYRGETVKACIVLRADSKGKVSESDIIAWAKEKMAAYKYPRIVSFVDSLPKSGSGKVLWRVLQDAERAAVSNAS